MLQGTSKRAFYPLLLLYGAGAQSTLQRAAGWAVEWLHSAPALLFCSQSNPNHPKYTHAYLQPSPAALHGKAAALSCCAQLTASTSSCSCSSPHTCRAQDDGACIHSLTESAWSHGRCLEGAEPCSSGRDALLQASRTAPARGGRALTAHSALACHGWPVFLPLAGVTPLGAALPLQRALHTSHWLGSSLTRKHLDPKNARRYAKPLPQSPTRLGADKKPEAKKAQQRVNGEIRAPVIRRVPLGPSRAVAACCFC